MMESRDRDKWLIGEEEIGTVITEALGIERRERGGSVYRHQRMIKILAAEVVRLECWGMWILSPEDIHHVAHDMGKILTSEQVSEVRRLVKEAFEYNNRNWRETVHDAIEEALDNET